MNFNKLVKKRASIRRYSSKKPPIEKITEAIVTANLAPSAGNLPVIRYTIVEDSETISKIADGCRQPWIKKAPFIVVICSDPTQTKRAYEERANMYIKQHVGAAIQNFLLKITDMKLASCWVGAFSDVTVANAINIPDGVTVEAVLPVGYQHPYDKSKQRPKPTLDNRVYFEKYKNKHKFPYRKVGEH